MQLISRLSVYWVGRRIDSAPPQIVEDGEYNKHITVEYIKTVVRDRFGFCPRQKQIECIRYVLVDQDDLILCVKTSFGKSLIYQAAPLMLNPPRAALVIMPLKALEDQQSEKLSAIEGCRPFVLNGDTNNHANLALIRQNRFTHGTRFIYICLIEVDEIY